MRRRLSGLASDCRLRRPRKNQREKNGRGVGPSFSPLFILLFFFLYFSFELRFARPGLLLLLEDDFAAVAADILFY